MVPLVWGKTGLAELGIADPQSVKNFREDLTALGTVYINDA